MRGRQRRVEGGAELFILDRDIAHMMPDSTEPHEYEVVIVGGGPAGMTAVLYSTQLGPDTAVVNRGGGRAAMMQEVHDLLGVKEETSRPVFLSIGQEKLETHRCNIHRDIVTRPAQRRRIREDQQGAAHGPMERLVDRPCQPEFRRVRRKLCRTRRFRRRSGRPRQGARNRERLRWPRTRRDTHRLGLHPSYPREIIVASFGANV